MKEYIKKQWKNNRGGFITILIIVGIVIISLWSNFVTPYLDYKKVYAEAEKICENHIKYDSVSKSYYIILKKDCVGKKICLNGMIEFPSREEVINGCITHIENEHDSREITGNMFSDFDGYSKWKKLDWE